MTIKILLVDDNHTFLTAVIRFLGMAHHRTPGGPQSRRMAAVTPFAPA